jgi:hypothetical protein
MRYLCPTKAITCPYRGPGPGPGTPTLHNTQNKYQINAIKKGVKKDN